MYVCVSVCHRYAEVCRSQKRVLVSLELEFQAGVSHLIGVPKTELVFCEGQEGIWREDHHQLFTHTFITQSLVCLQE